MYRFLCTCLLLYCYYPALHTKPEPEPETEAGRRDQRPKIKDQAYLGDLRDLGLCGRRSLHNGRRCLRDRFGRGRDWKEKMVIFGLLATANFEL